MIRRARRPPLGYLSLPPMVARPLNAGERALAPAYAHLATLNRQMAALKWLADNDPEEAT